MKRGICLLVGLLLLSTSNHATADGWSLFQVGLNRDARRELSHAGVDKYLGEFSPGQMVREFDDVVFNKEGGKVHGPVKTQFGFHLIEITKRTD